MKLYKSLLLFCLIISLLHCTIRDNPNDPASENFKVRQAPGPQFSKLSAVYHEPITVSIITPSEKFDIYYTLDGTIPTIETAILYDGNPIYINITTNIKAISFNEKWTASDPLEATFTIDPLPESISISPFSYNMETLTSQQLTAVLYYNNRTYENITNTVQWSTSDSSIASVDNTGTVQALQPGEAFVSAHYGDLSAYVKITIIAQGNGL